MLPSFRLIAATFFCSFLVVFVGLRMAASLNDLHEGLPVMAAHAAPVPVTPTADREARRGASAVPVMYDLRFAVTPVSPILVRSTPTLIERPMPSLPLAILPPEIAPAEASEPAQPDTTVAAIDRDADVAPATSTIPDTEVVTEPLPPLEPVTAPAAAVETPAPEAKAAAIEPQATPAAEPATPEPPAAASETAPSTAAPIPVQDTAAAKPVPAEPAAKPEPEHAKPAHAKPKAVAKPKPAHKPRVRTARRAMPAGNAFDFNNPALPTLSGPTRTQ